MGNKVGIYSSVSHGCCVSSQRPIPSWPMTADQKAQLAPDQLAQDQLVQKKKKKTLSAGCVFKRTCVCVHLEGLTVEM